MKYPGWSVYVLFLEKKLETESAAKTDPSSLTLETNVGTGFTMSSLDLKYDLVKADQR